MTMHMTGIIAARQHRPECLSEVTLRRANPQDQERILDFQSAALRIHAKRHYARCLIDRYIAEAGTMPADLLSDGRLFVLEHRGDIIATGGWRWRTDDGSAVTGLQMDEPRSVGPLGGTHAEIAAIYVDPFFARIGLATWLIACLEDDIRRTGLTEARIVTTLTGLPLCQKNGYRPFRLIPIVLDDGTEFQTVGLAKSLTRTIPASPMGAEQSRADPIHS
ncbi:MAG: GNAT family N-acetyltransferase [Hyphomicrobiaceae bacterium]